MWIMIPSGAVRLSDFYFQNLNLSPSLIVDMTLGNGRDSKRLLDNFPKAKLIGFDIQEEAIENSRRLLDGMDQDFQLLCLCHSNVRKVLDGQLADLIVFNFGYLPGGDKDITTKKESSLFAVRESLDCLSQGGLMSLTFYPGHLEGEREYKVIMEYLQGRDQKSYRILKSSYVNQKNKPPVLVLVERLI